MISLNDQQINAKVEQLLHIKYRLRLPSGIIVNTGESLQLNA
jgi:hypothetical protein